MCASPFCFNFFLSRHFEKKMQDCIDAFGGQAVGHELNDDASSWIVLVRKYHPSTPIEFDAAWNSRPATSPIGSIMGKQVAFPRRSMAYGRDYSFAGQTAESLPFDSLPKLCADYRSRMPLIDAHSLNGSLLNWYDSETGDYIGPHSDNEAGLVVSAPIVSITWTSPPTHFRRFRLTPKQGSKGHQLVIDLSDGDLIIMGGECQKTHKHEIMKTRKRSLAESSGRRINQTDRAFS